MEGNFLLPFLIAYIHKSWRPEVISTWNWAAILKNRSYAFSLYFSILLLRKCVVMNIKHALEPESSPNNRLKHSPGCLCFIFSKCRIYCTHKLLISKSSVNILSPVVFKIPSLNFRLKLHKALTFNHNIFFSLEQVAIYTSVNVCCLRKSIR